MDFYLYLRAFLLMLSITYIVGCSGVITAINKQVFTLIYGKITKYNGFRLPIISCAKCSTFWCVFGYLLIYGNDGIIIDLFVASTLSYLSIVFTDLMNVFLTNVLNKINNG